MSRLRKSGRRCIMRDEFSDTRAVGAVNGTLAVPGPGSRTVADAGGYLSVANSKLTITGGAGAWGNPGISYPAVARVPGLALSVKLNNTSFSSNVGLIRLGAAATHWSPATASGPGWYLNSAGRFQAVVDGYGSSTRVLTAGNFQELMDYTLTLVCRKTSGHFYIIQGGIYTNPTLVYVSAVGASTPLYPLLDSYNSPYTADDLQVRVLHGPICDDYGIALAIVNSPTDGQVVNGSPDGMVEFTWTPATSETLKIKVRRLDDNNCWECRCAQAGTVKMIEITGGGEDVKVSTAQTFTAGTSYRIVVSFWDATWRIYVNDIDKGEHHATYFHLNETGVGVSGFTTGVNLIVWPREVSIQPLGTVHPKRGFTAIGDSKTLGAGGDAYSPMGYETTLAVLLQAATGDVWDERPFRMGYGGFTVAVMQARVDQDLSYRSAIPAPEFVLFNLGANDVTSMPDEADYKADLAYMFDAVHTKWPNTKILVMRPWRRSYLTECNTLTGWNTTVMATRPWCSNGPDERVFLENGDDGASYTSDGVHPTQAGYTLTAQQWKTAMGF